MQKPPPNLAVLVSFRRGPKTQRPKEYLLRIPRITTSSEAARFIGRKVAWPVGERKCRGRIVALHGVKGLLRARFTRGVPGTAVGSYVEIVG